MDDCASIYELAKVLHPNLELEFEDFHRIFERILNRLESVCFVGEIDGQLIGYLSGNIRPVLIYGGNTAFVDEIVVCEEMRLKSVGAMLMTEFESWSAEANCKLVGLATGGARLFYERLGYQSSAGYYKKTLS